MSCFSICFWVFPNTRHKKNLMWRRFRDQIASTVDAEPMLYTSIQSQGETTKDQLNKLPVTSRNRNAHGPARRENRPRLAPANTKDPGLWAVVASSQKSVSDLDVLLISNVIRAFEYASPCFRKVELPHVLLQVLALQASAWFMCSPPC